MAIKTIQPKSVTSVLSAQFKIVGRKKEDDRHKKEQKASLRKPNEDRPSNKTVSSA